MTHETGGTSGSLIITVCGHSCLKHIWEFQNSLFINRTSQKMPLWLLLSILCGDGACGFFWGKLVLSGGNAEPLLDRSFVENTLQKNLETMGRKWNFEPDSVVLNNPE